MVIVKLKGGIGNQLFQFAFGRAIALSRKETLFFDLTYLNDSSLSITSRTFKLSRLNNYQLADQMILKDFSDINQKGNAVFVSDESSKESIRALLNDQNIHAILLDGYFQNQFYFLGLSNLIKSEIKNLLNYYLCDSGIITDNLIPTNTESVCIHVRRTDYLQPLTLQVHGICEAEYYQNALKIIRSKLTHLSFYLFSDDAAQAEQLFSTLIKEKVNISSILNHLELENRDLIELALMSRCKKFIIANSSYSWWGSFLSDERSKIIIAPKKWYQAEDLNQLSDDIGLKSWIRI